MSRPNTVTVFAASSLTEGFRAIERGFEAAHRDVDVRLVFAGSQVLSMQLKQGAVADVFACADQVHMQALVDQGIAHEPVMFAVGDLALVTPKDHPTRVRSFATLPSATRLVIGTEQVPLGIYTRELFKRTQAKLGADFAARVLAAVVSQEPNARLVRAKLLLGEADAAIMYRTDALSVDRLSTLPIPEGLAPTVRYTVAPLRRGQTREHGTAFIDYLSSIAGRRLLQAHGFELPPT